MAVNWCARSNSALENTTISSCCYSLVSATCSMLETYSTGVDTNIILVFEGIQASFSLLPDPLGPSYTSVMVSIFTYIPMPMLFGTLSNSCGCASSHLHLFYVLWKRLPPWHRNWMGWVSSSTLSFLPLPRNKDYSGFHRVILQQLVSEKACILSWKLFSNSGLAR